MAQLSPQSQALIEQIVSEETTADEADATHTTDVDALTAATLKESDSLLASRDAHAKVNATYRQLIASLATDFDQPIPQFETRAAKKKA